MPTTLGSRFLPIGGNDGGTIWCMGTSARAADCYDFVADCRIRAVTDLLSHSWDPVVLVALRQGPHRRNALITAIGDVSDKAVTESLRRLTASGLVTRTPDSTPRNVEYDLTALGASLVHGPLAVIGQWAIDHGHELVS